MNYINIQGYDIPQLTKNQKYWKKAKFKCKAPKDIAELIYWMVALKKATIYVHNGEIQCDSNKFRSTEDIFRLTKYYSPNTTLQDVLNILTILYENHITTHFCNDVKRYVHSVRSYGHTLESYRNKLGKHNIIFATIRKKS